MAALQLIGRSEDVAASTSTALVLRRGGAVVCHDVLGYYAELGVSPAATRQELARAYLDRQGPNSHRLTYVFHRLLDRSFRARYDALKHHQQPLDRYAKDEMMRRASLRAAQLNAERDFYISAKDILKSIGVQFTDSARDSLDSPDGAGFYESGSPFRQGGDPSTPVTTWSYAYLLLGSACDDRSRLAQWQAGLAATLADLPNLPRFAVGFHGLSGEPFLFLEVGGIPTFFLNESAEVTGELVKAAATAAIS